MKWTTSTRRAGSAAALLALAGALVMTAGSAGIAQSSNSASKNGLAGTWFVQVTIRNCASNAALGSFNSLVTFHRGGTISEATSSPSFAVGQRSPGHGNWDGEGHDVYSQHMVALINFDTPANPPASPGFFAGWATVTHSVELIDADHLTSAGTNAFYRSDGTLYRTGCSTAVGVRFE
jgi:hypothetical protein